MIGSKNISPCRVLTFVAMLSGAMLTTLIVPAYGQQEVDATWYDPVPNTVANVAPSAGPNATVVHPSQPAVAFHRRQAAATTVSPAERIGNSREKQPASQTKTSEIVTRRDRNQEEKLASIAH